MRLVNRSGVWYAVGRLKGVLYRTSTGVRVSGDHPPQEAVSKLKAIEAAIREAILYRHVIGPSVQSEAPTDGLVYFIADPAKRFVKIGWTGNIERRLRALQLAHPEQIHLLAHVPGDKRTEAEWHQRFKHLRCSGEWFRLTDELVAAIPTLTVIGMNQDHRPEVCRV